MPRATKHIPTPLPMPENVPILIVDDDEALRESLHLVLEFEYDGCVTVAEVAATPDAFTYLHSAAVPHIVLLDFRLHDANADMVLGLIQRYAALQCHRYVLMPAIEVTRLPYDAQKLINAVCAEVVMKPFDLTTMFEAVRRAEAQLAAGSPDEERS